MASILSYAKARLALGLFILGINIIMLFRLKQNMDIPSFIGLAYVFLFDFGLPFVSLFLTGFYFFWARKSQRSLIADLVYLFLIMSWFPYFQMRLKNEAWETGSLNDLIQLLYRFIGR